MHVTVGRHRWCVDSHDTLCSNSWQITDGYIVCSRASIEEDRSAVMSSGATYCLNQQEVHARINIKALRVAIYFYEMWQVYKHTVTYQAADPALGDVSAGYWRSTKLRHCTNTEQLWRLTRQILTAITAPWPQQFALAHCPEAAHFFACHPVSYSFQGRHQA